MALINQNSIIGVTSITSPSASNVLTVHTNDTTERLRVTADGVSFSGTNASLDTSGNLTVGGNISIGGTLTYEDVTNIDSVGIITARDAIVISEDNAIHFRGTASNNYDAILRQQANGGHLLINSRHIARINIDANSDSTDAYFAIGKDGATDTSTELFRVQEDGKVGIGTNNPNHKLTLFQSGTGTFDAINVVTGNTTSTGYQMGINSSGEVFHWNTTNSSINFATNNTERLRIDSSGNAILKTANAAFKSENPNSSGDYVRMYAGAGTAQWDIYGNGELLRMSENSGSSTSRIQFDLPTTHRSTSTTTGVAALTAQQEVNNGGYNIIEGKNSSNSTVFYASHNGRVGASEGIIFGSDTADGNVLDDYEEGNYRSNSYIRLYDPNNTSSSFPILNTGAWNSQGYYTKTGGNVLVNHRIQSPLNSNISNLSSTTYDSYLIRITLPFTVGGLGRDTTVYDRNTACGIFYCSQMDTDHPFFMQQQYGEDYATIASVGTWGDMRTRLSSSPNYQWWFSINYTAS